MIRNDKDKSRFLSLILRHQPDKIGIALDPQGWADVADLLARLPFALSRDRLLQIVAENDKQRFALSADGQRIRASQGHSISVDLDLPPCTPPEVLWHGTATATVPVVLAEGLRPMTRQHVHLSADVETARKVGARHGAPVVLTVAAGALARAGQVFYRSDNGVWLTDFVPPEALSAG
ncbi:RNA 2'-phosphotransferase [Neotabrizicola sp. VNH66]|uniref:RNA 2'-phosphotransferase n=1 Tax=Neotabrizicola sp. VNH66 TaxID=3400918 RepID=UPI003C101333